MTSASASPLPSDTAHSSRKKRQRLVRSSLALFFVALLAVWAIFRFPTIRPPDAVMPTDASCTESAASLANLSDAGGVGSVRCESWDIGTGVTGYVWRAPDARGVVLFQHGWGDYTQRWVNNAGRFIPELLAQGYSVYGYDMWGSGRSPGARGVTDIKSAVHDHRAAREMIGKSGDGTLPLFLAGHSIGGLVVASSVLEDQSDLAGVVLLAPGLLYDVPGPLLTVAEIAAFVAPGAPVPGMSNGEGAAALTSDPASITALEQDELLFKGAMNFLTASTGGSLSVENWPHYPVWHVPVLTIHGAADTLTDPKGSADFIDAVAAKDATYYLIDDARHSLLDDTMSDQISLLITNWLNSRVQ